MEGEGLQKLWMRRGCRGVGGGVAEAVEGRCVSCRKV